MKISDEHFIKKLFSRTGCIYDYFITNGKLFLRLYRNKKIFNKQSKLCYILQFRIIEKLFRLASAKNEHDLCSYLRYDNNFAKHMQKEISS